MTANGQGWVSFKTDKNILKLDYGVSCSPADMLKTTEHTLQTSELYMWPISQQSCLKKLNEKKNVSIRIIKEGTITILKLHCSVETKVYLLKEG